MFQTRLPKPSLAVVTPGGMSVMMVSSVAAGFGSAGSAGEKIGDVTGGVGCLFENQVPGRRNQNEMAIRKAGHPGLCLGGRTQPILGTPQNEGRRADAMQPMRELGVALRVVADQLGEARDLASELCVERRIGGLREIAQRGRRIVREIRRQLLWSDLEQSRCRRAWDDEPGGRDQHEP